MDRENRQFLFHLTNNKLNAHRLRGLYLFGMWVFGDTSLSMGIAHAVTYTNNKNITKYIIMKWKFRKILNVYTFLLVVSCLQISCDDSYIEDSEIYDTTTDNLDNDADVYNGVEVALSSLSKLNYPLDNDTWIITDSSASTEDFEGLIYAISSAKECDRNISLVFPYITVMPDDALNESSVFSVVAPKVKTIGSKAFYRCKSLTSINFATATIIDEYAFFGCSLLTSVDLPFATSIEDYSFCSCYALTKVNLPSATSVGYKTFYECRDLTTIILPSVRIVGERAFGICFALRVLSMATNNGARLISIHQDAFFNTLTKYISLVMGADNSEYVVWNILALGQFCESFDSITIID